MTATATQLPLLDVPYRMKEWPQHIQQPAKHIKFSTNWNGKLFTHFFTTIRLDNHYHEVGEYYKVMKDGEFLFRGKIHVKRTILLSQLTEIAAFQDTGYSLEETRELLKKMYPGKDWATQKLNVLLIQNIEWNKP